MAAPALKIKVWLVGWLGCMGWCVCFARRRKTFPPHHHQLLLLLLSPSALNPPNRHTPKNPNNNRLTLRVNGRQTLTENLYNNNNEKSSVFPMGRNHEKRLHTTLLQIYLVCVCVFLILKLRRSVVNCRAQEQPAVCAADGRLNQQQGTGGGGYDASIGDK